MNISVAIQILRQELVTFRAALSLLLLSLGFVALSMILINYRSYLSFTFNDYPLVAKFNVLWHIFLGSFAATTGVDLFFLTIMALLFGINMLLVLQKFQALKRRGNLRIMFGTGVLSLVAAGCASCGLSFASLIGLSAVIAILPFGGIELYLVAIAILLTSLIYNLHEIAKACKIT